MIKATNSFERLSVDFKGPVKGRYPYLLIIVDESSRYPIVFPCTNITAKTVIACLDSLFCFFEFPCYLHSDRGSSFLSRVIKEYLLYRGIASSHSSPYHPTGNSQCERVNQTICRTIKLTLRDRSLPEERWKDVLQKGLRCVRSLVCLATNGSPHERMFKFQRRAMTGTSMPTRLLSSEIVLLGRFIRNKSDPQCEQVKLLDANPTYAHII